MVNGVFIQGVPQRVSADTLRSDLEALIKSYRGKREFHIRFGTSMQETYEISQEGVLVVNTDDTMRVNVSTEKITDRGQVTARDAKFDVNAAIFLMEFRPEGPYSSLYQELSTFSQKYHY